MADNEGFASDKPAAYPQSDRSPVATPRHTAGEMALESGNPLREECWNRLSPVLRDRLNGLAGTVLEWWARVDDRGNPPRAVVFGEGGLFVADPTGRSGKKPHAVSGAAIVAGSLSTDYVDHTPSLDEAGAGAGVGSGSGSGRTSGSGTAPEIAGLDPAMRALLGNLPPRVQDLLQGPFAAGRPVRRMRWHYEGFADRFDVFVLFLQGDQDVTVAAGTMLIPEGHSSATAHWSLRVHRALVEPWKEYGAK